MLEAQSKKKMQHKMFLAKENQNFSFWFQIIYSQNIHNKC